MDIQRLPIGEHATPEADCIKLIDLPDGRVRLEGSALAGEESTSIIGDSLYATEADAEAAGVAWADGHGVRTLVVSRIRR